jgi:catalase
MNETPAKNFLTTATGAPVSDNVNIQTAGPRGPALLQEICLLEKMAHFDREVIPEGRMHAKGSGAHGTFTVTHDISAYIRKDLLIDWTPNTNVCALLIGGRGARCGGRGTGYSRIRSEVLHRRRYLGSRRKQHTGVFSSIRYDSPT